MPFNLTTVLADPAVNTLSSAVNQYGLYTLTVTLENGNAANDFLLAAIRKYASDNAISLKEDAHNSYLNFYMVPALEVGVGALDKTLATSSSNAINRRIPLSALVQSQDGSALYQSFDVAGLPAGYQYKYAFELVLNDAAEPDWINSSDTITLGGTSVSPPTVSLLVAEVGDTVQVTVDTADITDTPNFLMEVIDKTKAAMPENSYADSVVITSTFAFDAENKPVFTFSPLTPGMKKYVQYDIRVRARVETEGQADAASDAVTATAQSFTLPWLTEFVNQTVIKGKQIEDSLVTDLAQKMIDNAATREAIRTALNTGSFGTVAEAMYDLSREVAVAEFTGMATKFDAVREQLRRIALYSDFDESYGELVDLTDVETNDAFTFVTKQGFSGDIATSYFSWLDKAFHLGPVVEAGEIAAGKYYVTVRGPVYRDRAEILFS